MTSRLFLQRPVLGWALYDWANSAFSLIVVTAFVPVMLGSYWNDGVESTMTTFRLGTANSVASLIVAVLSPVLGAIADRAGRRKGFLVMLASLGIVMTGSLFFVAAGQWEAGLFCYVVASIGFAGGNTFNDSLLTDITATENYDEVSAYGFGLGYIGGALLFAFTVVLVSNPATFGLDGPNAAIRVSFLLVALWWAAFSLPLIFWVHEKPSGRVVPRGAISAGWRQLVNTLRDVGAQRNLVIFLIAYWLYIDGVDTIIRMAGDYGLAIGLGRQQVIFALLLANIVGFPAALCFGWFGRRYGPRRGIYVALSVYIVATALATLIDSASDFYSLAVTIGLVQGGVQSLSRSLYARLIPIDKVGEYFGFYNMLGKFAAIIGPVMTGYIALTFGSQRVGILSILVLFAAGLWLLSRVRIAGV